MPLERCTGCNWRKAGACFAADGKLQSGSGFRIAGVKAEPDSLNPRPYTLH